MPRVDQEDQTLDGDELAVVPPSRPAEEPAATAQPNEFMYVQRECPPPTPSPRSVFAAAAACSACPGDAAALNPAAPPCPQTRRRRR